MPLSHSKPQFPPLKSSLDDLDHRIACETFKAQGKWGCNAPSENHRRQPESDSDGLELNEDGTGSQAPGPVSHPHPPSLASGLARASSCCNQSTEGSWPLLGTRNTHQGSVLQEAHPRLLLKTPPRGKNHFCFQRQSQVGKRLAQCPPAHRQPSPSGSLAFLLTSFPDHFSWHPTLYLPAPWHTAPSTTGASLQTSHGNLL